MCRQRKKKEHFCNEQVEWVKTGHGNVCKFTIPAYFSSWERMGFDGWNIKCEDWGKKRRESEGD